MSALHFRPHPLLRGGHLQTIATAFLAAPPSTIDSQAHPIPLDDGDALVVHEDVPEGWTVGDPSLLLIHGLSGCHRASYMVRLAQRFPRRGVRVFRADMRGCGAAFELATGLNHAGRSGDLLRVLEWIAARTEAGPLWAIGVSLGGAQLLKLLGELGDGAMRHPAVTERLTRAAAVSPPVDLERCAAHMQRLITMPYNRYFIRQLLQRVPPRVRASEAFRALDLRRRPRSLFELDDRVTAPLSGFAGAVDYYTSSSAARVIAASTVDTLVLAAADDPIVPCRSYNAVPWPPGTQLELAPGGGHVAFLARGENRYWMDSRLEQWFLHEGN